MLRDIRNNKDKKEKEYDEKVETHEETEQHEEVEQRAIIGDCENVEELENDEDLEKSEEKKRIQQQASERFHNAMKKGRSKQTKFALKNRRRIINQRDSLAQERLIGTNDLLPISYLQVGFQKGNAVCKILIRDRIGKRRGSGSGFLIAPGILMTNNHVLESKETAQYSIAEFNYQDDEHFMPCPVYHFVLDPEKFFITDKKLDFTMVAIKEISTNGKSLQDFGFIQLIPQEGKIMEGEYVSIIQHPKGGPKSITIRENQVKFIFEDYLHYLTDTEPGSSGSPVFNDQWVAVGLHHSGVPDPNNKKKWIANEGIRISSIANFVLKASKKMNDEEKQIVQKIFLNSPLPKEPSKREPSAEEPSGGEPSKKKPSAENPSKEDPSKKPPAKEDPIHEDPSKEEPGAKGNQKGYVEEFLGSGYQVNLPQLSKTMKEDVTRKKNGNYVLDYTHFSIVMCRSRGLAYFTAVNINGNQRIKIKRGNDNWRFDTRISESDQYGNEVYAANDLDRGHLVRREDPNWGTQDTAVRANDDTFHFTNSAPQHKNLNQKIWLGLENHILDNASAHGLKISVFTGPVFREDDMIYRKKFKIPRDFWKVVVMVKEDGKLSATAYLQTQADMITNLEFAFGAYETYQVPITKIEELTGLKFGELSKYDPIAKIEAAGLKITDLSQIRL